MNLEEEIRTVMETFISMKKHACENGGGPQDLVPMIHFKYRHLKGYCGVLLAGEGHPIYQATEAWGKILGHGIPEFMMFMVEGYASTDISGYKRGAMEEDFKNNPDSKVQEVITVHAVDIKTGSQMTGVVSYKYDDGGMPVFGDVNVGLCEGEALKCDVALVIGHCRDLTISILDDAA